MMKYISDQIRRDSVEVGHGHCCRCFQFLWFSQELGSRSSEDLSHKITYKPPSGPQTAPAKRKFHPQHSGRLRRPDCESDSVSTPRNMQQRRCPPAETPPPPPPPPAPPRPPKSPQILRKASGLLRSQSVPGRPTEHLRPCLLTSNRDPSLPRGLRSRSQTPSKVTFKADVKPREVHSLEWVDFKTNGNSYLMKYKLF